MNSSVSSWPRLLKAFARRGIAVTCENGVYRVRRGDASAHILLPAEFPLEAKGVAQLLDFASVGWPDRPHPVRCACATPDFHPGSLAPVGSIVATDPDVVVPAAIGTDINCGMRLITTGVRQDLLAAHESRWTAHLTRRLLNGETDAPVPSAAFRALFTDGAHAFVDALAPEGVWAGADRARDAWPRGHRHPASGLYALRGGEADAFLEAMGTAARYAWLNRVVLAEWVREALEAAVGASQSRLVVDVPHNVVTREHGMNLHRKGATPAHAGQWALLPGSMGDASYLVTGLGHPGWLWSCSHGAGRAVRRQAVRRTHVDDNSEAPTWRCIALREERRLEEAPEAYKPIGPVIAAQEHAGLLRAAVKLRPWRTFKA